MGRNEVASTSVRCHFNDMCHLGYFFDFKTGFLIPLKQSQYPDPFCKMDLDLMGLFWERKPHLISELHKTDLDILRSFWKGKFPSSSQINTIDQDQLVPLAGSNSCEVIEFFFWLKLLSSEVRYCVVLFSGTIFGFHFYLTLLHSERPKLHTILAFLSAI